VRSDGADIELAFVGAPSTSDLGINGDIARAARDDAALTWITDASDADVQRLIDEADVFLSFGIEGFGIPVVEAIRRGKPVLFGGTQPAAEALVGVGAIDVGGDDVDAISRSLRDYASTSSVQTITRAVEPLRVPQWRDFAQGLQAVVAQVTRR
jgi:glycosyltransferase involved in cell wall biosynthesis